MADTPSTRASKGRIRELDALRGLAALSVVVFHYTVILPRFFPAAAPAPFHFPYGAYGVQLFFMISGFVIFMTLERSKRSMDFLVSRFSRLYPVYWAAMLTTFTVGTFWPLQGQNYFPVQVAANVTMLQDYFKLGEIDGVYWSLSYELGFYFAMFTLYKLGRLKDIEYICAFWVAGTVLFTYFPRYIPHPLPYLLVINSYGHLFAAGIIFFLINRSGFTVTRVLTLLAVVVAQYLEDDMTGAIIIAGFVVLMTVTLHGRLSAILNHKVLVYFGTISYSLYLIHQLVGYRIIRALQENGVPGPASLVIAALAVIGIASTLTFAVERPAMAFIRGRYKARLAAREAATHRVQALSKSVSQD